MGPRQLSSISSLLRPALIDSDNHVLVVNKPAGWHTVPNQQKSADKCLMHFARQQRWGGGTQKDFLSPLHRLDQPCTGLQLYGKTSKAASRIQSSWGDVGKLYVCVLDQKKNLHNLRDLSKVVKKDNTFTWYGLGGYLKTSKRSVEFSHRPSSRNQSYSEIHWSCIEMISKKRAVVAVKTQQGHRHMIRALLGQACSIAGDLRYGAEKPLPDQSVALHSYYLRLPMHLKLGSVEPGKLLQADIPYAWKDWFSISQTSLQNQLDPLAELV